MPLCTRALVTLGVVSALAGARAAEDAAVGDGGGADPVMLTSGGGGAGGSGGVDAAHPHLLRPIGVVREALIACTEGGDCVRVASAGMLLRGEDPGALAAAVEEEGGVLAEARDADGGGSDGTSGSVDKDGGGGTPAPAAGLHLFPGVPHAAAWGAPVVTAGGAPRAPPPPPGRPDVLALLQAVVISALVGVGVAAVVHLAS